MNGCGRIVMIVEELLEQGIFVYVEGKLVLWFIVEWEGMDVWVFEVEVNDIIII